MKPQPVVAGVAAPLAVAAGAAVVSGHPGTTYGGSAWWLLALEVATGAALVLGSRLDVAGTPVLLLGAFWLVPELAGALGLPVWLRTMCDGFAWAVPALVVAAVLRTLPTPEVVAPRTLVRAALAVAAAAFATRLLLVDPFRERACWRLCEHNPWSVGPSLPPDSTRVVQVMVAAGLVALSYLALRSLVQQNVAASVVRRCAWGALAAVVLSLVVLLPPGPPVMSGSAVATTAFCVGQALVLTWASLGFLELLRRWRLERRLTRLVRVLDASARGDGVDEWLRRATRDESLSVRYWSPGRGGYVGADGETTVVGPERFSTFVERAGRPVAVIDHAGRVDGGRLGRAIDPGLRVVLENAQLRAATLVELAELTSSRARVVQRAEVERRRLERNLHDGAQQRAVSLALMVRMLVRQPDVDPTQPATRRAQALSRAVLEELRRVARGIYPAVLTDAGLAGAAADLAEASTDVVVLVDGVPERRYPPALERAAYLVLQAACADARDRGATQVCIRGLSSDPLVVETTDDAAPGPASWVGGLDDQVQALGGSLTATPRGGLTCVRLELPCVR